MLTANLITIFLSLFSRVNVESKGRLAVKVSKAEWRVFYVKHQTLKTVFNHIPKHREESCKYDAQRRVFD